MHCKYSELTSPQITSAADKITRKMRNVFGNNIIGNNNTFTSNNLKWDDTDGDTSDNCRIM